jgi:hypothetical protein
MFVTIPLPVGTIGFGQNGGALLET